MAKDRSKINLGVDITLQQIWNNIVGWLFATSENEQKGWD